MTSHYNAKRLKQVSHKISAMPKTPLNMAEISEISEYGVHSVALLAIKKWTPSLTNIFLTKCYFSLYTFQNVGKFPAKYKN